MATPKDGYFYNGKRIPGTTTIIGRFKDSGGLLHWAHQQGVEGRSLYEKRDEAADIGTRAHSMIENHINGDPQTETHPDAINAFEQYLKWERQSHIKMLSKFQEIRMVSPTHMFGGTYDAVGEIDGEVVLLDWKTSNSVYCDYLIQLAAYRHLLEFGVRMDTGEPLSFDLPLSNGAHLLRVSKDSPDFAHYYFGDLSEGWEQFVLFREAYEIDKKLKKRVK